jgi:cytochrome c1
MRGLIIALAAAFVLVAASAPTPAHAAEDAEHPEEYEFSYEGVFGAYDRGQLQRGFLVYKQVCATCHSLEHLSYRHLGEPGGPYEAFYVTNHETGAEEMSLAPEGHAPRRVNVNDNPWVRAFAAEAVIMDVDRENGLEMERPGRPSDRFARPFANEYVARAGNGGALPPDLSVISAARHGGAEYVRSLLMGYSGDIVDGRHVNHFFPGGLIAMPAPLVEGMVIYEDGTEASVEQMSTDVAAFLHWATDPHLEDRNRLGAMVIAFLIVLSLLLYLAYRQVWRGVKH